MVFNFKTLLGNPLDDEDEFVARQGNTNPLAGLLGTDPLQQSEIPEGFGNEISVSGRRAPLSGQESVLRDDYTAPPPPPSMGNRDWIEESADAEKNAPKRKGLFGAKGTLRDIIGILGDALLVGQGGQAIYTPGRQQEKISDAMQGFTGTDEEARAAIERVARHDPDQAQKMIEWYQARKQKEAALESQDMARRDLSDDRVYTNQTQARNVIGRLFQAALEVGTPEAMAYAERQAALIANRVGLSVEDLGIGPDMSLDERRVLAGSDMNVYQQKQLPMAQQRLEQGERRTRATEMRAARPPQGRAPSDSEVTVPIMRKMNRVGWEGLTPQEKDVMRSAGKHPDRGSGGKKSAPKFQLPPLPEGF